MYLNHGEIYEESSEDNPIVPYDVFDSRRILGLAAYIILGIRPDAAHAAAIVARFTGSKQTDKKYYRHTGWPGGIKERTPENFVERNQPEEILKLAVKRMLPRGPLSKKQLTKLKIYKSEKHPHEAQKIVNIDFGKLNKKNIRTN